MIDVSRLYAKSYSRFVLILCLIWFSRVIASNYECHEDYSCYNFTIIETDTIECYGSYSCSKSNIIETNLIHDIECDGSFSCFNSNSIENNDAIIRCGGIFSCSFVKKIYNTGEKLCLVNFYNIIILFVCII